MPSHWLFFLLSTSAQVFQTAPAHVNLCCTLHTYTAYTPWCVHSTGQYKASPVWQLSVSVYFCLSSSHFSWSGAPCMAHHLCWGGGAKGIRCLFQTHHPFCPSDRLKWLAKQTVNPRAGVRMWIGRLFTCWWLSYSTAGFALPILSHKHKKRGWFS